ncbi:unnamed protein product [Calypogeia fissa]
MLPKMQSSQCIAGRPAVLHTWVTLRHGEKLMNNNQTMARSCSVLLGNRKAARKSAIRATLSAESETQRRKEKSVATGHGSNGSASRLGETKLNSQEEKGSRVRRYGALDYIEFVQDFFKDDGGPPRWFCPVQRGQEGPAPLLLFLPGLLDAGSGLLFHYESLGRLFELRCLHIPNMDRTPVEGLVPLVEGTVREEARQFPGRPIYLVGENFGGSLALAVAARNPRLDLVLILLNPSTSFEKSALQILLPAIQALPTQIFTVAPFLLGSLLSDPNRLTSSKISSSLPSYETAQQVFDSLRRVVSVLEKMVSSLSKETLLWKLQMLNSSAKYANSRLQDLKADVLVLASNQDRLLPSLEEARRLTKTLPNCTYRQHEESSHSLLLEGDFDLATAIKRPGMYRQTAVKDIVANFVPATEDEINTLYEDTRLLRKLLSPVFFSTGADGKVVEGLSRLPSKGPLLFVGNHSLYAMDLKTMISTLLKDRKMVLRGLAHPIAFVKELIEENPKIFEGDTGRLYGAVPVSGRNFYKMLARGENVVLYPGGSREALHRKGETHKLIWPDQPEFVKMASRFGATIIPMATVGEDDILDIVLDLDEMTSLPLVGDSIRDYFESMPKLRTDMDGEISKQPSHTPLVVPKLPGPGRLYIIFGKPIPMEGNRQYFKDPKNVNAAYLELKGEVEALMSYLLKKREEDPYRSFLPRILYEASLGEDVQAPTFKP